MGRASNILYLSPEQRAIVDACIRRHHYVDIVVAVAELEAKGIELSKSGLHRYALKLKERDALHAGTQDGTIVIIVERGTGAVTTLTTGASRDAIAGMIAGLA